MNDEYLDSNLDYLYEDPEWHEGFEYADKMAEAFKKMAIEELRYALKEISEQAKRDEDTFWHAPWKSDKTGFVECNESMLERGYSYREEIILKIQALMADIEALPME